jgi:hypothetical protein
VHWVRDIAIVLALIWLLLVALTTARAQEPTPDAAICQGIETDGGQTLIIANVQITLPDGDFTRSIAPPTDPASAFSICDVETGATVTISGTDCEEVSREADSDAGEAILDEIVHSCVVVPPNVPPPGVEACPPGGTPFDGGQTVTLSDAIRLTLPEGEFVIIPSSDEVVQICKAGGTPTFSLSLVDCHRVDIAAPNDPDADLVQSIVDSCVPLNPAPAPTTAPLTPNPNIQPPNTGDAGLLVR